MQTNTPTDQSPSKLPGAQASSGGILTLALCQDCLAVFQTTHEQLNSCDYAIGDGNRLCENCGGDLCACGACAHEAAERLAMYEEGEAAKLCKRPQCFAPMQLYQDVCVSMDVRCAGCSFFDEAPF